MSASAGAEPFAEEIAAKASLSAEARNLLRKDQPVLDYIKLLIGQQKHDDAVHMVANLLPKREAVWWAVQAARQTSGEKPAPDIEAAMKASERWVTELSDESRRACWAIGNKAGVGTPAGCAAVAAYFSGGSLGPPEKDPIPPDELITGKLVATSVLVSALKGDAKNMREFFQKFLEQGIELYRETRREADPQL